MATRIECYSAGKAGSCKTYGQLARLSQEEPVADRSLDVSPLSQPIIKRLAGVIMGCRSSVIALV